VALREDSVGTPRGLSLPEGEASAASRAASSAIVLTKKPLRGGQMRRPFPPSAWREETLCLAGSNAEMRIYIIMR
jgi:hypothetical protein